MSCFGRPFDTNLKIKLKKYGKELESETKQMRNRITYLRLGVTIPEEKRQEVLKMCSHCSARVYLEREPLSQFAATHCVNRMWLRFELDVSAGQISTILT